MKKYRKDHEFLKKLQNENDVVFNCAITQILTDGVYKCHQYDIEKIVKKIDKNSHFSKDFQIAVFETAKKISLNVSPWNVLVFFKEEVPARTIKMSYERLMIITRNLLEMIIYPEDGGDHMDISEIKDFAGIDEDEWDEIWR